MSGLFFALRLLVALAILLTAGWTALGIWFRLPAGEVLRSATIALPGLLALAAAVAVVRWRGLRWLGGFFATMLVFAIWWGSIEPSNDRDWIVDVARPPAVDFDGSRVTIKNIRNFDYRSETDFDERWEERAYDLSKLTGVDLFLSHWSSPAIAHTIVSWEFSDNLPLAISIETRKEKGEAYSSIRGFFREYELYYVVADERDLVRLRTNYRGEQVFLYRVKMPIDRARAILVDYLEEIDRLSVEPRWYNALTHNCTTAIRKHIMHVAGNQPFDWRILANGYLDELMYERGTIDTSLPFAELKARSNIDARAKAADRDPSFSAHIREGIP